jgi:hypothetical protein
MREDQNNKMVKEHQIPEYARLNANYHKPPWKSGTGRRASLTFSATLAALILALEA